MKKDINNITNIKLNDLGQGNENLTINLEQIETMTIVSETISTINSNLTVKRLEYVNGSLGIGIGSMLHFMFASGNMTITSVRSDNLWIGIRMGLGNGNLTLNHVQENAPMS
ncbi:unnamed protein product [Gordionus sp. m RMFG-2023]